MKIIPWPRGASVWAARTLIAVVAVAGLALAAAGASTVLAARRLAALAPGGVQIADLSYNPFTGALRLLNVTARDAEGRTIFTSPRVVAHADVTAVFLGHVTLRRLEIISPRVVVGRSEPAMVRLADARGWPGPGVPLTIEGVMVMDGTLVVRDGTQGDAEPIARGIDIRLDRLDVASPRGWIDAAFLIRMTAYGTTMNLTGRPGAGDDYTVSIRARDADLARWLGDLPLPGVTATPGARGDVDATVTIAGGRVFVSGTVRGGPVNVAVGSAARMRVRGVHVVVERFGLATGKGGNITVHLQSPRVTVVTRDPARVLDEAAQSTAPLRERGLSRLTVSDGEVTLVSPTGRRLARVDDLTVGMDARARRDLVVSAAGRVGRRGRISLRGVVRPAQGSFDGDVHLADVALSALGAPLVASARATQGAVTFSGHVHVADVGGATSALVSGHASLAAARMTWTTPVARDFAADALSVAVRRYEWPRGVAVIDSLSLTGPTSSVVTAGSSGVVMNDDGVVVTQSVTEPTPIDGLLAAVATASRYRMDVASGQGDATDGSRTGREMADAEVSAAVPLVR